MSTPTAIRWANLALQRAKESAGKGGWRLLSPELRHALVCQQLVGILAAQEIANGDHMRDACDAVTTMECA